MPYIYERQESGVKVRLVVGFMDQAPSEEELDEENEKPKRRAEDAGWTIIANERVVVYKDKTSLTGWGSNRVPNYHNQFISISGVVEFASDDASKLPINTTKRGLDASSELYLKVRDRMQEGVRIFTQHTNNWKSNKEEEKRLFSSARNVPVRDVASFVPDEEWVRPRGGVDERYFMPHLPKPHGKGVKTKFMRFSKPVSEIEMVAEYLFQNRDVPSSEVAQRCFEMIHEEASEEL
ncbi:hypothetical protein HOP52_19405 [Halomonas campisalis]|uniref:Uncharacterized protein n=1 Tax=Billgrantia campisalis TaxID=74661 RepID=A0ABS9PDR0_9GAMM|nr:hypothetical protein [Halomonas campisalis]MCG6659911.1 hypothetical protein [Halomonas campisalis]